MIRSRGFSLVQVLVSLGLLGGVLAAMMKFNLLQINNIKRERSFKESILAKGFIDQYLSIPSFCGSFLNPITQNELQNGFTRATAANNVFQNMNFNQADSLLEISQMTITKPATTNINNIPNNEKELRVYNINFRTIRREPNGQIERNLYDEDKEIEFLIHNDGGNLVLDKCHLSGSKTVSMQKVLCEEVGGEYTEDYLCLFGNAPKDKFMDYLCEVEKMVVQIEKVGEPPICSNGNATCVPPILLFAGVPAKPTAQTTYCDVIE